MKIEQMSFDSEEITNTLSAVVEESNDVYEYPLNVNAYGEQLKLTGSNKDMYLSIAFLFQPASGLSEFNLDSWLLEDKIGMLEDEAEINAEMKALTQALQDAGLDSIASITAVKDSEELGSWMLTFVTQSGDSFIIDPFVAASLR